MDQTPEQKPEVSPVAPAAAQSKKVFLLGFFGFLAAVVVLGLGFSIFRVYARTPLDNFSYTLAKVLRLPAAKVNGERILFTDYVEDMRAIEAMRDYDKANNGKSATLTDEQLSDQVLFRMVNNVLVKSLAARYGVVVAQSDIDYVKSNILEKEFGSLSNAEKAIKDRYGWTFAMFEQKVIRPFVMQQKLEKIINSDEASRAVIKTKAELVLNEIKAGANFASSAIQYGQDGTAKAGGELGWFGKGEMVPAFEDAAFKLKKGELSSTLVESPFGYHILQVEDKKTDKVKDPTTNKLVNKDLVKARHILFMFPTLETKLNEELQKVSLHLYLKLHNPFAELTGNK